jgi:hypothetical protein
MRVRLGVYGYPDPFTIQVDTIVGCTSTSTMLRRPSSPSRLPSSHLQAPTPAQPGLARIWSSTIRPLRSPSGSHVVQAPTRPRSLTPGSALFPRHRSHRSPRTTALPSTVSRWCSRTRISRYAYFMLHVDQRSSSTASSLRRSHAIRTSTVSAKSLLAPASVATSPSTAPSRPTGREMLPIPSIRTSMCCFPGLRSSLN